MDAEQNPLEHALVGTVLAERYRVERFLGQGGMGAVYLGEHILMKKAVALKVLHREMTGHGEIVARFEREAVAAGRIDHPNVAAASDFGRLEDGSFYLVLEYVDGRSLAAVVDEGPMALPRSLVIAEQIAGALVAAHDAGVVHRDLKPENVMLVLGPDGTDHVKVLDFGIAKVDTVSDPSANPTPSGRQLTRVGAVMGTVGYMAPEQALGQPVDHRVDLYAFGVLLYEMLSGRPPFVAEELSQVIAKQLTEKPAPLPEGTPIELSLLIGRLLETLPADRPSSAVEVKAAIACLRGFPSQTDLPVEAVALSHSLSDVGVRDTIPAGERSGSGVVAIVVAAVLGLGLAWRAASASPEPASSVATGMPAVSAPNLGSVLNGHEASSSEGARGTQWAGIASTKNAVAVPASAPETHTTVSESKTTSPDGHTVTTRTTRTSHRTTVSEKSEKRSTRRRTGPGGIYIPPPSQWFK